MSEEHEAWTRLRSETLDLQRLAYEPLAIASSFDALQELMASEPGLIGVTAQETRAIVAHSVGQPSQPAAPSHLMLVSSTRITEVRFGLGFNGVRDLVWTIHPMVHLTSIEVDVEARRVEVRRAHCEALVLRVGKSNSKAFYDFVGTINTLWNDA